MKPSERIKEIFDENMSDIRTRTPEVYLVSKINSVAEAWGIEL